MKRFLLAFLALTLLTPLALAAEETVYSRAIVLPVEPDETPEAGTLNVTYEDPASGQTYVDPDGPYAKGAKIAVKTAGDAGFAAPAPEKPEDPAKVFGGWATKKSAVKGESAYAPGRTVTMKADLTLYAVWVTEGKETPTQLIYHRNTGKEKKQTEAHMDGETVTLKDASDFGWSPSKKTFLGWSTDPDAVKPAFGAGDQVIVTGAKNHLYAVWQEEGKHVSVWKYITNKQWNKYGDLILFKAGDTIKFNIEVTNTGSVTLDKVIVYEAMKGVKIKKGSGYKIDGDGDAVIVNLDPQETVVVRASYTVRSSDLYKKELYNTAFAYYGKGEVSDSVYLPLRYRKTTPEPAVYVTPAPVQPTLTVYADTSLAVALNRLRSAYAIQYPAYPVDIVYGDAEELAARFAAGAYGDVFIALGDEAMDAMDIQTDEEGNPGRLDRILSSTRTEIMANRAVLAGRFGTQAAFTQVPALLTAGQARLGISVGQDAAGMLAASVLSDLGADEDALRASGMLNEYASGEEATAALLSGGCDLAILPASDALAAGLTAADTAPDSLADPVAYPAAVLRTSAAPNAGLQFLTFLRSAEARRILTELGYIVR